MILVAYVDTKAMNTGGIWVKNGKSHPSHSLLGVLLRTHALVIASTSSRLQREKNLLIVLGEKCYHTNVMYNNPRDDF